MGDSGGEARVWVAGCYGGPDPTSKRTESKALSFGRVMVRNLLRPGLF